MKKNSLIKKWAENLNRNFTLEDVQMANKYMKRCPTLLIIKELQVKNTMKYNYTLIREAEIKKIDIDNARYWRGFGATGTLMHSWWEYKMM